MRVDGRSYRSIWPAEDASGVYVIDQTRLPHVFDTMRLSRVEDFVTARFCLYTTHQDHVYRCEIHHLPWPLQDAEANFERNTVASAADITLPSSAPLLHFSKRLEVLIWPLRRADSPVLHV